MDQFIQARFRDVLLGPMQFPLTFALFLKEEAGWSVDQEALVADVDEADDDSTAVGKVISEGRWQYILEISTIRSIIENLLQEFDGSGLEIRCKALIFYFERDAYPRGEDLVG